MEPKIHFKVGKKDKTQTTVNMYLMHPYMLGLLSICAEIYASYGLALVVTSINDSKHSEKSYHFDGFAFDLRVWGLEDIDGVVERITRRMEMYLPLTWRYIDVINEEDHIHVELNVRQMEVDELKNLINATYLPAPKKG